MIPEFTHGEAVTEVLALQVTMETRLKDWCTALNRLPYSNLFEETDTLAGSLTSSALAGWLDISNEGVEDYDHSILFGFFKNGRAILFPDCKDNPNCPAVKLSGRQEGSWSEIFTSLLEITEKCIGTIPLPPK